MRQKAIKTPKMGLFLNFYLHCIRQARHSQATFLVNGTDIKRRATLSEEIWSAHLISFFFKWSCCADLYASFLALFSAGDWMGLSTVVSNLRHLDECVPAPRLCRPNRSFSKLQTRQQRAARIEPLAYSTGADNRQDSSRLSVRRFHTFPKFQRFFCF